MRFLSWMRVGLTDLGGDLKRFGVLIACLALGTSVIAAVGSVGAGLKTTVERDATALMGGDFEAINAERNADPAELTYLKSLGKVAHVVDTSARAVANDESAFLDMVAVDDAYPLIGAVRSPQLSGGAKPAVLLGEKDGAYGAIADPVLIDRLGIKLGERFKIGKTEFQLRGLLSSLPDSAVRGFHLGVTTLISTKALAQMTDLRPPLPGLLTSHRYKVLLNGVDYETARKNFLSRFNAKQWRVRSPREAAGTLVRFYDLFSRYLLIVGLSSLLVGGVGVSNGVTAYINERQRSIATLRTLGATGSRILVHFMTQIGVLTLIGVGIGVALGAAASLVMLPLVGRALAVDLTPSLHLVPLMTAVGFGLLTGFAFSYLPLSRAQSISPALLFRAFGATMAGGRRGMVHFLKPSVFVPLGLAMLGILALAVITTNDVMLVGYYAVGVVLSFILLRAAGGLLQAGLRALPPMGGLSFRHAVRNIYNPGSAAPVVVVSIGLGLAMLLVIALLDTNLHNQLLGVVSRDAPTFVATDLFPDEVDTLADLEKSDPQMVGFEHSPMLRGAIVEINGHNPDTLQAPDEEATFVLSQEIPVTWAADVPAQSKVVAGKWWPKDYSGPPLVSLRTTLAKALGLKVGDTLTVRMFGDRIKARVANLREFEVQKGLNFLITFAPGALEAYPTTYLGTIKAAPGAEKALERTLFKTLPDVSFIPIGQALNQLANILGQLGLAVNIVGGLAVVNGLLVLAGTMVAGRKQREADAVVNKVLGATRTQVLIAFMLEFGLLGAFAAVIASVVGIVAAWAITINALQVGFAVDPFLIGGVIVLAIVLTIAAGAATTWQALSTRPAQYLRTV